MKKPSPNKQLLQAIRENNLEAAQQAIVAGADVNHILKAKRYYGLPGFNIMTGETGIMDNVEVYAIEEKPMLFEAIETRNLDMIQLLIKNGADCSLSHTHKDLKTKEVSTVDTFESCLKKNFIKIRTNLFGKSKMVLDDKAWEKHLRLTTPTGKMEKVPEDFDDCSKN